MIIQLYNIIQWFIISAQWDWDGGMVHLTSRQRCLIDSQLLDNVDVGPRNLWHLWLMTIRWFRPCSDSRVQKQMGTPPAWSIGNRLFMRWCCSFSQGHDIAKHPCTIANKSTDWRSSFCSIHPLSRGKPAQETQQLLRIFFPAISSMRKKTWDVQVPTADNWCKSWEKSMGIYW